MIKIARQKNQTKEKPQKKNRKKKTKDTDKSWRVTLLVFAVLICTWWWVLDLSRENSQCAAVSHNGLEPRAAD